MRRIEVYDEDATKLILIASRLGVQMKDAVHILVASYNGEGKKKKEEKEWSFSFLSGNNCVRKLFFKKGIALGTFIWYTVAVKKQNKQNKEYELYVNK